MNGGLWSWQSALPTMTFLMYRYRRILLLAGSSLEELADPDGPFRPDRRQCRRSPSRQSAQAVGSDDRLGTRAPDGAPGTGSIKGAAVSFRSTTSFVDRRKRQDRPPMPVPHEVLQCCVGVGLHDDIKCNPASTRTAQRLSAGHVGGSAAADACHRQSLKTRPYCRKVRFRRPDQEQVFQQQRPRAQRARRTRIVKNREVDLPPMQPVDQIARVRADRGAGRRSGGTFQSGDQRHGNDVRDRRRQPDRDLAGQRRIDVRSAGCGFPSSSATIRRRA